MTFILVLSGAVLAFAVPTSFRFQDFYSYLSTSPAYFHSYWPPYGAESHQLEELYQKSMAELDKVRNELEMISMKLREIKTTRRKKFPSIIELEKLQRRVQGVFNTMAPLQLEAQKVKIKQEAIQNQLMIMSVKLDELEKTKEPVVAFRATSMQNYVSKKILKNNPGNNSIYIYSLLTKTATWE